jgi:hypothetical protein
VIPRRIRSPRLDTRRQRQGARTFPVLAVLGLLMGCIPTQARGASSSGTTTFILDGNRVYAEVGFVRPDGSIHRALVFVDMGSPSMALKESLFKELQLDQGKPLLLRVGEFPLGVTSGEVASDHSEPRSMGSDLKVEGLLPAGVLQKYQVAIDYRNRTLTLARPGTLRPDGIALPFHLKKRTGLIAVDVAIDGKPYSAAIDNGSAYTWFRRGTVTDWLSAHPGWERGVGAVGASNMTMSGDGTEASGILARLPEIAVGPLMLKEVGVLGAGDGRSPVADLNLFDWYSSKNEVPVIGWIGGNVLKNFRLTIDYPNRMSYWLKQADPEINDLDQVGLTLRAERGEYFVEAVARRNGMPTVEGVLPGDRLIRVGELEMKTATWGAIYDAMHGRPGEIRRLVVERAGNRIAIAARVSRF